jgi:hypothetical protein
MATVKMPSTGVTAGPNGRFGASAIGLGEFFSPERRPGGGGVRLVRDPHPLPQDGVQVHQHPAAQQHVEVVLADGRATR